MASVLEKLASLDRQQTKLTIVSRDGERETEVIYIRPTLIQDQILQKQLTEEYESVVRGLKAAPEHSDESSIYDKLLGQFEKLGKATAINYVLRKDMLEIRAGVIREQNLTPLTPLPEDASEEDKQRFKDDEKEFLDVFRPAFDKRLEEARASLDSQNDLLELCSRAAALEIEERAMNRAFEIHRRNLVAQSIYEPDDLADKPPKLVFKNADEVALKLSENTISTIAARVSEELDKERSLPLRLAGKK